jgi:hypothetical protein
MANQIKTKFIGNDQVTSEKVLLENNSALRAKDSSSVTQDFLKIDATNKVIAYRSTGAEEIAYKSDVDSGGTALTNHLNDTDDAHDASAISYVAGGDIVATNVQDAIEELDSEKLALAGGTMSGSIDMGEFDVTNAGMFQTKVANDEQSQLIPGGLGVNNTVSDNSSAVFSYAIGVGNNTTGSGISITATGGISSGTDMTISSPALMTLSATSGIEINSPLDMNSYVLSGVPAATANGHPLVFDQLGSANGVAPLNASSKIDALYLPSYVDDVLEFGSLAGFPVSGESEKIYVALDTNKTYRWSGSTYIEISPSEVNSVNGFTGIVTLDTDDVSEGSTNLYFTEARAKTAAVSDAAYGSGWDGVLDVAPSKNAVYDEMQLAKGRLDVLEAIEWATPFKKTLNGTDISNGYIDLPHEAVETNGMSAYVDRLAIHQGEDYTLSVVGGVTRITFAGDLVSPGNQQLQSGDSIYVRYQRSV